MLVVRFIIVSAFPYFFTFRTSMLTRVLTLSLCITLSISQYVLGQVSSDSLLKRHLFDYKQAFDKEDYNGAMDNLKKVFALKITLPDEIAYYYGVTLLKQGSIVKGKEAIDKYIQLQGEKGKYYSEAKLLIVEADAAICKKCKNSGSVEIAESCEHCKGLGKSQGPCRNCSGKGQVLCFLCKGHGVHKKGSGFNERYENCTQCNVTGRTSCGGCNGDGMNKTICKHCKGDGKVFIKVNCLHE